ncbi:hypothetical protein GE061_003645 [Apolygus lucorum]|uniref:Uncharacterized protein n=1 Tax=Apolygus lucorum TaxID=248454 RepID=A0A8S9X2M8_APOLU|nr:hypothetical protein GE061_003645 [Apolygus lucorum]
MPLRYKRSRQLAAEIEDVGSKWGVRVVSPSGGGMRIEPKKDSAMSKAPVRQHRQASEKPPQTTCPVKCYCHEGRTPKKIESRKSEKSAETRKTWDQILSQHLDLGAKEERIPAKRRQFCWEEKTRPMERPSSLGRETFSRRILDDWCHPGCFVSDLIENKPEELVELKKSIDRAVKKMGLKDRCPQEEPTRDCDRPKVVLEYLEELNVEMLKKRLEENESRFNNMRKTLEGALAANKLEIQSLKSELFMKHEEVSRLVKNQESQVNAAAVKRREREFIERITSLDDRIKNMMDRDERNIRELEKYQGLVAELKFDLSKAREERDLCHAKMEIYQQERDQAVASLSVYQKTFKNLKHEIGEEIRGIRPSLELTADSCGTLDTTGRVPRDVVTSSPNGSFRTASFPKDDRKQTSTKTPSKLKKRTKHTLADSALVAMPPVSSTAIENKENAGEVLLKKLEVLGKEFKQFSENVFPLALRLDDEANQLLNLSSSTGLMRRESSCISRASAYRSGNKEHCVFFSCLTYFLFLTTALIVLEIDGNEKLFPASWLVELCVLPRDFLEETNNMNTTMQPSAFVIILLVHLVADPALPGSTVSANHSDSTPPFFSDTDYRDYNISEDHAADAGHPKAPSVPVVEKKDTTEQTLCIRTTIKNGSEDLSIIVHLVIRGDGIIVGTQTFVIGKQNFEHIGCTKFIIEASGNAPDMTLVGALFFDFAVGTFLLSLCFLCALKIVKWAFELTQLGIHRRRAGIITTIRGHRYHEVTRHPRPRHSVGLL